jgi:NAD(P)-dependent dehydrogenase (short-subunit alcohol dehydrogenase family)
MGDSPIALITGANRGLGLETARQLGRLGMTVLLGVRCVEGGTCIAEELAREGIAASALALDVTDAAMIRAAAAEVASRHGRLDILVNNAGILDRVADNDPESTTLETFRRVFEVNFFGLVAVTQAFVPLLKTSPAGRIVNLTSILGSIAEHADPNSQIYGEHHPAYDASKAAVNMYTVELANALRDGPMKINAAHPGWVRTVMGGERAPLTIPAGAQTIVALATVGAHGPSGGCFHLGSHLRW